MQTHSSHSPDQEHQESPGVPSAVSISKNGLAKFSDQRPGSVVQQKMQVQSLNHGMIQSSRVAMPHQGVVQRVLSIGGAILHGDQAQQMANQIPQVPGQQMMQMVNDRANTYAFPSQDALLQYLQGNNAHAPQITPIQPSSLEQARRRKRLHNFHLRTEREDVLAKSPAFHKLPKNQLYRLGKNRNWRYNIKRKQYERFRKKNEKPFQHERVLEYVDPKNANRLNYGYLRGRQVITTRTDPRSSAGYSRSGAQGKKKYVDARGGFKNKKKYTHTKTSVNPFKRRKDDKTFTIGHSQAVKNMSSALDETGLNSDQQPLLMVPENRTVGEQMKNPALEPEDDPYVWNNFYSQNPDTTHSGAPIPSHTEATLFDANDKVKLNVKLTNDGSIDYRKEREKFRTQTGNSKAKYMDYMKAKTQTKFEPPEHYDSNEEDDFGDIPVDTPFSPAYMDEYQEQDTLMTQNDEQYGSMVPHKGSNWRVENQLEDDPTGKKKFLVSKVKDYQADLAKFQLVHAKVKKIMIKLKVPKKPPSKPLVTTSQQTNLTPLQQQVKPKKTELKEVVSTRDSLISAVQHVIDTINPMYANHLAVTQRVQQLNQIINLANQADMSLEASEEYLVNLYTPLNTLFHELEPVLQRTLSYIGGASEGDFGNRLSSLEQYMAECGQMAVHNVDALERAEAANDLGNLNNYTGREDRLRAHGNFANNIMDDQIRQMLANAARAGVPVIGSIGQLQTFVNEYNQFEQQGNALGQANQGAQRLIQYWHLPNQQVQEVQNIRNFINGTTDRLNIIINTEADLVLPQGHHWITVRLERHPGRPIRIFYLDSMRGATDYRLLFLALRQFVNMAAQQNAQHNVQGHSKPKPKPSNGPGSNNSNTKGPVFI